MGSSFITVLAIVCVAVILNICYAQVRYGVVKTCDVIHRLIDCVVFGFRFGDSSHLHPAGESAVYYHLVRMHHCLALIVFPAQMAELRTMVALSVHRILLIAAKLRLIH